MLADFFRDDAGKLPIFLIGIAVMPSAAEGTRDAAIVHIKNLGILLTHPGRRAGCRRTDHRVDSSFSQFFHYRIQPFEMILALLWLETAPGELAHPHRIDSGIYKQLDIFLKIVRRLLFRIICHPIIHVFFLTFL